MGDFWPHLASFGGVSVAEFWPPSGAGGGHGCRSQSGRSLTTVAGVGSGAFRVASAAGRH